jgi:hypothetical protein
MPTITDQSTIFSLTQLITYTALNSGNQGSQDFTNIFIDEVSFVPMAKIVDFNSTSRLTTGFNTYFKMQGYNPLTGTYETWHCRGTPLLLPPSGNHLLNVAVVTSWIDR